jgi:hypothetical protein
MRVLAIALLTLFAFCGRGWAWGDTGHQVVCEIAFQLVGNDTRAAIRRLMRNDQEYDTFTESCIYPDHPHKRAPEHFINLERNAQDIPAPTPPEHCLITEDCQPRCPTAPKCLLTAIKNDFDIVSDRRNNRPADRLKALKYLGHWVGDIHQPLHVSFEDDRGGNDISISGCPGSSNLHAAWDKCLVLKAVGDDVSAAATSLVESLTTAQKEEWTATEPREWANESFKIAERSEIKYCVKEGTSCKSPDPQEVEIDAAYIQMSTPIIKERLLKAGVRLSHLLDEAFGQ